MDQQALAHLQASLGKERVVRRHEDLWDACRLHKIQIFRDLYQQSLVRQQVLGLAAASRNAHHALPWLPGADQRSDSIDFARELQSRYIRRRSRRCWIAARALRQISPVDARRIHTHTYLVPYRHRALDILDR
jgi:hypothetical protein